MQFTSDALSFRDVVKAACEVAPSKGIKPEHSCIFIQATDGGINVSARDESMAIELDLPGMVLEEGDALVPSRMLLDYLNLMGGQISVSTDSKNRLVLKSGKKQSDIACLDSDLFSPLKCVESNVFTVSGSALATGIARTRFAVSTDETRPQICGICVEIPPVGDATFVALDGIKVSMCSVPVKRQEEAAEKLTVIIPNAAIGLISSQFSTAQSVSFALDKYRATVTSNDRRLSFPLCAKEYLDFRRIIPKALATDVLVNAKPFLEAVKIAGVAAGAAPSRDGKWNVIRLDVSAAKNTVRVSAATEASEASTEVDCQVQGNDMTICFNVRYVQETAAVCAKEGDQIAFGFQTPTSPAYMRPAGEIPALNTYICPVRSYQ